MRYAIGNDFEGPAVKRRRRSGGADGLRAVKRACIDAGFGLAPRVVGWEVFGSPERKIVTRSSGAREEMVELSEEEEDVGLFGNEEVEDEEGDVTVEILDEKGLVVGVENAEQGREAGWEDDDADENAEITDDQIEHISASEASRRDIPDHEVKQDAKPDSSLPNTDGNIEKEEENEEPSTTTTSPNDNDVTEAEAQHASVAVLQDAIRLQLAREREESLTLPDGFVSPAKRPIARIGKRRSMAARRRTLPMQFAPAVSVETSTNVDIEHNGDSVESAEEDITPAYDESAEAEVADTDRNNVLDSVEETSPPDEQEWEDVETSESEVGTIDAGDDFPLTAEASGDEEDDRTIVKGFSQDNFTSIDDDATLTKLPSSPVPSVEGAHPRLPLRRSPRRKSSSPLKQSMTLPSTEKSHLIAFTPLKSVFSFSMQLPEDISSQDPPLSSPIERSASAPPEEPTMSPRKPSRPRVSDDTALLQAFLNRAAESKGTSSTNSGISVSKRESLSNRRDSDAVRQALASPAKPSSTTDVLVLGELDVNSPSPRKSAGLSSSAGITTESNIFDNVIAEAANKAEDEAARGDSEDDGGSRTRRSGRTSAKKNPQPTTVSTALQPAATNRISIRAPNGDGRVVLKRSEAQELALLTRNNTRKNKGGAILPPLRLTKMAVVFASQTADGSQIDVADETAQEGGKESKKGVKWAEQLVDFYQGANGDVSESSVLSDELGGSMNGEPGEERDTKSDKMTSSSSLSSTVAAPPPPSETPSKPKIRKLKAPRTAASTTPGKTQPPPAAAATTTELVPAPAEKAETKPSLPKPTTTRRSRIATPAKGLLSSSLLPADLDPQPVVPTPAITPQAQQQKKRKAPISKLPAPSSTSLSASATSSVVGQGKENMASSTSLLLSPPKKKAAPPAKAAFAPKLDFGSGPKMASSDSTGDEQVPGLMSPAKKGGRTTRLLAPGNDESGRREVEAEIPMGLRSPAKKRTRRAV